MSGRDDMIEAFPQAYFETRFRTTSGTATWPARFVIVTAWATTGECWAAADNETADARLAARLHARGRLPVRITGYSPTTGHAEPGWAAELARDEALAIGREFRQHAIYVIDGDALAVQRCADGMTAAVGGFRARLDLP